MNTYHFKTVVASDGSVHLSDLPPDTEVEVLVVERSEPAKEMQAWLADIRARHPFASMSKEEILDALRRTREAVWADRYAKNLS